MFLLLCLSIHLSAIEDARRLDEAESTEDLSMNVCDNPPRKTVPEDFQFGLCNSNFQCWKPLFGADPQASGVCLRSDIVEGIVAGDLQPSVSLLMNIYQVIQQDHTADQVEMAKTAILEAINGQDGLKSKVDAIKVTVDDIETDLTTIGGNVDDIEGIVRTIKPTIDRIDVNTKGRRRLGTDSVLSDESIEELLRSHTENLNEKAKENGVPGQVVSCV